MQKICKKCGKPFEARTRSLYCNEYRRIKCAVCNKEFNSYCNVSAPITCSNKCASKLIQEKKCAICGSMFKPNSSRQKYCKKSIEKVCKICGKTYQTYCGDLTSDTCSKECTNIFIHQRQVESYKNVERRCEWCGALFNPVNNTQKYCMNTHYQTCIICNKQFEIDLHHTQKQDIKKTCSTECANKLKFIDGNPFQKQDCREKAKKTCLEKYGVEHPMQSQEIASKVYLTYKNRTGYSHPSHNPDVRSRSAIKGKKSKFEIRIESLLKEYQINYIHHHMITRDNISHEFDFYLPDYKFLIDCDGVYYHSYLSDPDGGKVLDYYDEDRLSLVPSDHIFHVIVEGQEEKDIKYIVDILKQIDSKIFDYEGELFKWCRSIEFPYPQYSETRMRQDYEQLCKCHYDKYVPSAKLAISVINQFHKSIYDAHVGNYCSPKEAWYDDKLLKKVIANRLIYKNDVDPFKIMKGFNISKICPRVSIFNPVLARYLVLKYLNDYNTVFDPFSGYSGRLLGVASTNKKYIGHDLNETAVDESNQIIKFLNLQNCSVTVSDILQDDNAEYDCILTCPPYNKKEIYNSEQEFKSCDDWIDLILSKYKCKKYIFVVDTTQRYTDKIAETLKATSHFSTVEEKVLIM